MWCTTSRVVGGCSGATQVKAGACVVESVKHMVMCFMGAIATILTLMLVTQQHLPWDRWAGWGVCCCQGGSAEGNCIVIGGAEG